MKPYRGWTAPIVILAIQLGSSIPGGPGAPAGAEASLDERCRAEVIGLHQFLQGWLGGTIEPTEESLHRFSTVLAPEFEIITPGGERIGRDSLIAGMRDAHGARAGSAPPFRIRIEAYEGKPLGPDLRLVTYEEWQEADGRRRGRLSSALFRTRGETPHGVEWVHLHETWIPEQTGKAGAGVRRARPVPSAS